MWYKWKSLSIMKVKAPKSMNQHWMEKANSVRKTMNFGTRTKHGFLRKKNSLERKPRQLKEMAVFCEKYSKSLKDLFSCAYERTERELFQEIWSEAQKCLPEDTVALFGSITEIKICIYELFTVNLGNKFYDTGMRLFKKTFKWLKDSFSYKINSTNKRNESYARSKAGFFALVVKLIDMTGVLPTTCLPGDIDLVFLFSGIKTKVHENRLDIFDSVNRDEECFLQEYYKYMQIASALFGPKKEKKRMDTCAILEGSGKRYVTGGKALDPTLRREFLFHYCSRVPPKNIKKRSGGDSSGTDRVAKRVRDDHEYFEPSCTLHV